MAHAYSVPTAKSRLMSLARHSAVCAALVGVLALTSCGDCSTVGASADPTLNTPADELAHCEALYALFWRYRLTGGETPQGSSYQGILEADAAVQKCRTGNTQDGIAALRRKVGAGGCR